MYPILNSNAKIDLKIFSQQSLIEDQSILVTRFCNKCTLLLSQTLLMMKLTCLVLINWNQSVGREKRQTQHHTHITPIW